MIRDLLAALVLLSLVVNTGCAPQEASSKSRSASNAAKESQEASGATEYVSTVAHDHNSSGNSDWNKFRGGNADGASAEVGLPLTWSQSENVVWKTPLPGAGASSPVVWNNRVYLTAYTGYQVPGESGGSLDNLKRHLLAFDLETGKQLWETKITAKLPEENSIRDHGYAANTPVVDENAIYVFWGKTGVNAYDHDGNSIWNADVGNGTNGWGTSASPVLFENLLIVNASVESESLVALDSKTGDEKWRADGINEAWNTPYLAKAQNGRPEVVVATHGKIKAFDPQTGKSLWTCETDISWYMVPSPVVIDDVIFYLGGRSGTASLAVRLGGSGDVTATHRLWTSNKGSNVSSPVAQNGYLYYMNDQRGTAFCVNAKTGDVEYEQRLDRAGQVYSSALLADERVYYITRDGKTFVLKASPEFKQLAVNELRDGGQFNGSPAVAGNKILIRSDKYLYCLGE